MLDVLLGGSPHVVSKVQVMSFLKKLFGRSPEKLRSRALNALEQGHWMDARLGCQDALEAFPQGTPEHSELRAALDRASEEIALEHLESAEACLEAHEPENAEQWAALAREIATTSSTQQRATRVLKGSANAPGRVIQDHVLAADQDLLSDDDFDEEIEALFEAQGERAEAYRAVGSELGKALQANSMGNGSEARKRLKALAKKMPKDPFVAYELGHSLHAIGDLPGAAKNLRKAISGDPNRTDAVLEMAEVAMAQGHRKGALEVLEAFPLPEPRINQQLAETRIALGKLDEARAGLQASLGTPSESPAVYRYLGLLSLKEGDLKAGGRFLEKAYQKGSADPANGLALVDHLQSQGTDLIRAIEIINGLAERDEAGRFFYFRRIGELYLDQGNRDEAIALFEQALKLTPENMRQHREVTEKILAKAREEA